MSARRTRPAALLLAALAPLVAVAAVSCTADEPAKGPRSPLAKMCDNLRPGPAKAPAGAVVVDPAVDKDLAIKNRANPPGTTFWLAPGRHTIGRNEFGQVMPKDGNTYLGAPGAVLDGRKINRYAFTGKADGVTIKHLTVRRFVSPTNEGVVNHDSGNDWVIEHNSIENNGGAGMATGARQKVRFNCLRENGQYGINAYQDGGQLAGLVIERNEIVGNNTDDWEAKIHGCGCTGGVKFWAVNGADVRGNWIHDNRGAGLWGDTNNNDFLIAGNVIEDNDGAAIIYETSYNAVIRDNVIRRNNWVDGRKFVDNGDVWPVATIYISESGGEPRVKARTDRIAIHGNTFTDNWSGITLWENADRFCNSPANTSTGHCTLLVEDVSQCKRPAITRTPLLGDCRWKTQRVDIHHNRFELDTDVVECATLCGRMAVISNFGTSPRWSPYQETLVQEAITFRQHNRWHDNTYVGPWTFMPYDTSRIIESTEWQSAPHRQDQGSTFTLRAVP